MNKVIVFFKTLVAGLGVLIMFAFVIFGLKTNSDYKNLFKLFERYEKVILVTENNIMHETKIVNGEKKYYTYLKNQEGRAIDVLTDLSCEGLVFRFSESLDLEYFKNLFNFNLSDSKEIANLQVYSGYTSLFNRFIFENNKKINVQVAKTNSGWIVGLPVILTGF